jgi:hypothetical protein
MAFRFRIRAPIIETTIVSTHPLQTGIHSGGIPAGTSGGFLQKYGSAIAAKINSEFIIRGTYQILLGFCFIMKKQAVADNNPYRA